MACVGRDGHRVQVVVQLGLGEQFLEAAVGVQAAAAVAELAGQELEVGGDHVDSPDRLADVGGRRLVDRGAQVLEDRVDLGEPASSRAAAEENRSMPVLNAAWFSIDGVVELLGDLAKDWPWPAGSRPRWS